MESSLSTSSRSRHISNSVHSHFKKTLAKVLLESPPSSTLEKLTSLIQDLLKAIPNDAFEFGTVRVFQCFIKELTNYHLENKFIRSACFRNLSVIAEIRLKKIQGPSLFHEGTLETLLDELIQLSKVLPLFTLEANAIPKLHILHEVLLRINDSYDYHSKTENFLIEARIESLFFEKIETLYQTIKKMPFPFTLETFKDSILLQLSIEEERSQAHSIIIEILKLVFFPKGLPIFHLVTLSKIQDIQKRSAKHLIPPVITLDYLLDKTIQSWIAFKDTPDNPVKYFRRIIERLISNYIKGKFPIPPRLNSLQDAFIKSK